MAGISDLFGVSFMPGAENSEGSAPVSQEAIKLLNLRLPTVMGAQSPVPQSILFGGPQGTGGLQGAPENNALIQQLRKILGLGGVGAPPSPTAPTSGFSGPSLPGAPPIPGAPPSSPAPAPAPTPAPSTPPRGGRPRGPGNSGAPGMGSGGSYGPLPSPSLVVDNSYPGRGRNA